MWGYVNVVVSCGFFIQRFFFGFYDVWQRCVMWFVQMQVSGDDCRYFYRDGLQVVVDFMGDFCVVVVDVQFRCEGCLGLIQQSGQYLIGCVYVVVDCLFVGDDQIRLFFFDNFCEDFGYGQRFDVLVYVVCGYNQDCVISVYCEGGVQGFLSLFYIDGYGYDFVCFVCFFQMDCFFDGNFVERVY